MHQSANPGMGCFIPLHQCDFMCKTGGKNNSDKFKFHQMKCYLHGLVGTSVNLNQLVSLLKWLGANIQYMSPVPAWHKSYRASKKISRVILLAPRHSIYYCQPSLHNWDFEILNSKFSSSKISNFKFQTSYSKLWIPTFKLHISKFQNPNVKNLRQTTLCG